MLEDEGYKFMGAAFEVYNQLGYGMAEEVYQQCIKKLSGNVEPIFPEVS